MKESYCGLCDQCQLDHPEFLEAVAKVKSLRGPVSDLLVGALFLGRRAVFPCRNFARVWSGFSPIPNARGAEAGGGWIAAPSASAPSIGGASIVLSVPTWPSATALN